MKRLTLPLTDFKIPQISLGCMSLPEDSSKAAQIINAALDAGINLLDTADLYQKGLNEQNVGKAIKNRREEVLLSSKVGNQWRSDGSGWDWNPRKSYILEAVEKSLQRLQTDYLDFYLLHGGTIDDPWDETLEAFEILKQQGKIRAFGISSIRPNVIRNVLKKDPPALIMMQYSLLDRRPEESVFPLLEKSDTRVLVRGSLAKGLLLDKDPKDYLNHTARDVQKIREVIQASGHDPQAILLAFGLSQPAVASLSVGVSNLNQVQKLIQAYDSSQRISIELIQALRKEIPAFTYENHR
ncbi:MAG: aldo/keto reductase [Algoriphagus sp.]|uniref:aldo/keto reductase n=1 Tax=Algoriphagus sp. TaxID=1872435 RepID=UPI0017A19BA7|nr:aldo/keto reductase [Algoriphagus sp.]NVJ87030.1 aldo/keto reductase [Algoriphagus sp.]